MKTQPERYDEATTENTLYVERTNGIETVLKLLSRNIDVVKNYCQASDQNFGNNIWNNITTKQNKTSFLVFKRHKYITVPTENIAFFHVKYESPMIVGFDQQEYSLTHSLEQIQTLVNEKQFFRLNRQYLINFRAIKEVEHYFARKLLVNLVVPVADKLLVSKEKVTSFLQWLDNR